MQQGTWFAEWFGEHSTPTWGVLFQHSSTMFISHNVERHNGEIRAHRLMWLYRFSWNFPNTEENRPGDALISRGASGGMFDRIVDQSNVPIRSNSNIV